MRKVTDAERMAWERKQRVALMVRTGEAAKAEYVAARNDWLKARAQALKLNRASR